MSIQKIVTAVCLTVLTFNFSSSVKADNLLEFSIDGGNTFGDSFVIDADSSVEVDIFLSETAPDTALANDGLVGFGLRGLLGSTDAGSISAGNLDSVYDFPATEEFTADSVTLEGLVLNNPVPTGSRIALGSFLFDSSGEGTSILTFGDIQPGAGSANANWLTGAGVELDEAVFGAGSAGTFRLTLSTSAIPEPSSLMVLGLVSAVTVLRRKRLVS